MKGFFLVVTGCIFLLAVIVGIILAFIDIKAKDRKKYKGRVMLFWLVEALFLAISIQCFMAI